MKIAVTSQNYRTVTGHAGKTRKFLVYETDGDGGFRETERLALPKEMSIHAHPVDESHPLDGMDFVITSGCGQGFINKLAARGVRVFLTEQEDPEAAVRELLALLDEKTVH